MIESPFSPAGLVRVDDQIEHFAELWRVLHVRRIDQRVSMLLRNDRGDQIELERSVYAPILRVEKGAEP
jgi:hypothetical protein